MKNKLVQFTIYKTPKGYNVGVFEFINSSKLAAYPFCTHLNFKSKAKLIKWIEENLE